MRITRRDEALAILTNPEFSSDPDKLTGGYPFPAQFSQALLFMDPPQHDELRHILAPAFTRRAMEEWRPRIAAITEAALDELGEEFELMSELAYPVTLAIIAELMDVGAEGAEVMREETPKLVAILEPDARPGELVQAAGAAASLALFLLPLLAERQRDPGEDLLSQIAGRLDVEKAYAMCILLLAAGHETTANLIGNGVLALLGDPRPVLEDPAAAVEELLRFHSPVKRITRASPTGEWVDVMLDDINRDGPVHLAFGHGPHFCLGAHLARIEAAEVLYRFFRRFPDVVAKAVTRRPSSTFHALTELHIARPTASSSP